MRSRTGHASVIALAILVVFTTSSTAVAAPVPCAACKASGSVRCSSCPPCKACEGFGRARCGTCFGEAFVLCGNCAGAGKITSTRPVYEVGAPNPRNDVDIIVSRCAPCKGTGKEKCPKCKGDGGAKCSKCSGKGYAGPCEICKSSRKSTCLICAGKGKIDAAPVIAELAVRGHTFPYHKISYVGDADEFHVSALKSRSADTAIMIAGDLPDAVARFAVEGEKIWDENMPARAALVEKYDGAIFLRPYTVIETKVDGAMVAVTIARDDESDRDQATLVLRPPPRHTIHLAQAPELRSTIVVPCSLQFARIVELLEDDDPFTKERFFSHFEFVVLDPIPAAPMTVPVREKDH